MTTWHVIGTAVAAVLLTLLILDRFAFEIPYVRKFREVVLGALGILVGFLLFWRKRDDDPDEPEPEKPTEYDDDPERELDRKADDLDLDSGSTDRDLDELRDSNEELRRRLDDL